MWVMESPLSKYYVMSEIRDVIDELKADDNTSIEVENYFILPCLHIMRSAFYNT